MSNKKDIQEWTLDKIRSMNDDFSNIIGWLEDERREWFPCISNAVSHVVSGGTLLLYTDSNLAWFKEYIMRKINIPSNNRPFATIHTLENYTLALAENEDIDTINMHLSMSYSNYAFWYIGRYHDKSAKLALNTDGSLLWLLDEQYPGAFCLHSSDDKLSYKLLQLYEIFENMIFGSIFGEFED